MSKNTQNTAHLKAALKWWNKHTFEEKFYKTIAANSVIDGDKTRHPDSLSDDEIQSVFEFHICFGENLK